MNTNTKIALIGGSIIGAGALAYLLFRSSGSKETGANNQNRRVLTREQVVGVLKSLKKELFAVVMQISMMAQQMKQYSQGKLDYDIKDFIFSYPAISQELQSSIDKAYRKNGITEQELQSNCETTFKDDKEIQSMMAGIRTMIDNAAEGKEIDMKTELPEFLTSETLLQIIEKIMRETTKHMQTIFKQIKDQYGELNLNDPRIAQQLQTLQADDIKANIFAEYNLEEFDDPAQKIVSFATQKFAQESPEFQQKMMTLELKQRKSMEGIMQNPGSEGLVDKIFAEEAPSLGPAGGAFPGFHAQRRRQQATAPAPAAVSKPAETTVVEEKKPEVSSVQENAPVENEVNAPAEAQESAPVAQEVAHETAPVVEESNVKVILPEVAHETAPVVEESNVKVILPEVASVQESVEVVEEKEPEVVEAVVEEAHKPVEPAVIAEADHQLQESVEQIHAVEHPAEQAQVQEQEQHHVPEAHVSEQ